MYKTISDRWSNLLTNTSLMTGLIFHYSNSGNRLSDKQEDEGALKTGEFIYLDRFEYVCEYELFIWSFMLNLGLISV